MKDFVIDTYKPAHFNRLTELMAKLQEVERSLSNDRIPGILMAEKHLRYLLLLADSSGGATWVSCDQSGLVCGFLVLTVEEMDREDVHLQQKYRRWGEVTDLYVDKPHRGLGIGRQLLNSAEMHCQKIGLARLMVSTLQSNQSAVAMYQRCRYKPQLVTLVKNLDNPEL